MWSVPCPTARSGQQRRRAVSASCPMYWIIITLVTWFAKTVLVMLGLTSGAPMTTCKRP